MAQQDFDVEVLDQEINEFELSFKLIIIGDSGVGKSCLALRATKDSFEKLYSATIGFEFMTFFIRVDGKAIKLQIWDTCGQEVYRSLINGFYRNSSLAILVYSITSLKSFKNLEIWLNDIKVNSNPDIKIFLIGNKKDLEEKREVPIDSAKNFFKEHGLYAFMESSAKTGFNAQKMFIDAAHVLVEENARLEQRFKNISDNNNDKIKKEKIKLTQEDEIYSDTDDDLKNKKRRKCC